MTKLVIGSVANHPFAIRADRVEKTVEVQSFSRFMRGQRDDVVAAVIEDRVQFLTDLSVRLGLNGLSQTGRAGLITAPDQQISGILAQDPPTTINVEDESVLPVSRYIGSSVMEACALIGDQFVPILSDEFFNELQQSEKVRAWSPAEHIAVEGEPKGGFFAVQVGQLHCAFANDGFGEPGATPAIVPLPFAPERIVGLARLNDEMVAVANVGAALALDGQKDATTLIPYERGEVAAYFLVSEYLGAAIGREFALPKLLRRAGIGRALEADDELLPIIAAAAILGSLPDESITHETDSSFHEALFHQPVSVTEFSFGDFIYAVPTEEVQDEIDRFRSYPFWANHPLIKRVACTDEMLLPELDLAGYLGHDSDAASSTPLYVKNGDFEAVFAADALMGQRALQPHEQKPLPTELPHDLVYGCYLDGREVRLILNLAAIAEHATDERLQNVLASISGANRVGVASGRSQKAKFTPTAIPAEGGAPEPDPEEEVESTTTAREEPTAPALEKDPVDTNDVQEQHPRPTDTSGSDEISLDASVADLEGSETPDVELDLEHEELENEELEQEAEPNDNAIDLEIEPPLTIDPQMASWQNETDDGESHGAETPTRDNERFAESESAAAFSVGGRPEHTVVSDMSTQNKNSPKQKRRRGRAIVLILFLVVAAVVGGVYLFQRSLFNRLLAQAEDTVRTAVASAAQGRDTSERGGRRSDDPLDEERGDAARSAGGEDRVESAPIDRASATEPETVSEPTGNSSGENSAEDAAVAQSTASSDQPTQLDFTERVYFAADSAELLPDQRETLNRIVERVNGGQRWSIEIVGHVARAQHGTTESYRWLSEQRAITVRDYLLPRLNARPLELEITGRGASEPVASNATASGRALNRRVQVIVEPASE